MKNEETTEAPAVETPKIKRSLSVALYDEQGSLLRILSLRRADGSATCFATHTTKAEKGKKPVTTRGATSKHASFEDAVKAGEKLAAAAMKAGWVRKQRMSGFTARPDAFAADALPKPAKQK